MEIVTATLGAALFAAAIAANQSWLDRHFLPSFFIERRWYVLIEAIVRTGIAAAGVSFVLGRSSIARLATRAPAMTLRLVLAVGLAVVSSELALRSLHLQPTGWLVREEEPRRKDDPQLGWVLAPSRTGRNTIAGRSVEYAIDPAGYRVDAAGHAVDPRIPTIVFGGESVMFGEGLTWEESIPAQVGSMLGVQSANAAVHGYSSDQIYMRLAGELPRFSAPVAVVSIFMTELFGRNLDADRPHLGPGLVWQPAQHRSRLMALAGLLVPYRSGTTVERGIRMTREVLRATIALARRREAIPLVVVPQFGPDDDAPRALREAILGGDIPVALVRLDQEWRLAWDRHPNSHAAHVIAAAVAAQLGLRARQAAIRIPRHAG